MKKFLLGITFSLSLFVTYAQSQWDTNPASANNPVITATGDEQTKLVVSDGANGAIVIAQSYNTFDFPFSFTFSAQKINSNGVVQWGSTETPKIIYSNTGEVVNDYLYTAISDGNGGAYVAWLTEVITATDDTITNNYIQHINSSGDISWAATGLKVNSDVARRGSGQLSLCQDGSGGVVVVWSESDFDETTQLTTFSQVYAQRYNSAGAKQWTATGVPVCTANGLRGGSTVVNDGSNGFVIYFADARNSNHYLGPDGELFDNADVYAQKLNTSGSLQWAAAGVAVATTPLNQWPAGGFGGLGNIDNGAVADGAGGSIILIDQYKLDSGDHNKYLAQRLNGSGAKQWAAGGVSVCNLDSAKFVIKTLSDGANGMVAVWSDYRNPSSGPFSGGAIYAQRIVSGGTANWTADGLNVSGASETVDFYTADATDDGSGNYIFTWSKFSFDGMNLTGGVVARKINNSGAQQWGASPKPVCTNEAAVATSAAIVKSNSGSAIIAWLDQRNNTGLSLNGIDIFAGKIAFDGSLGGGGGTTPVTYTFTGYGDWSVAGNWSNNTIPPSTLPSGSTIIIASGDFLCRLNVSQTISAGATLIVNAGNNLVVQGKLDIK